VSEKRSLESALGLVKVGCIRYKGYIRKAIEAFMAAGSVLDKVGKVLEGHVDR
jgi:hypothetical protein